jgi:two-component system sensor histidine kinase CpxA
MLREKAAQGDFSTQERYLDEIDEDIRELDQLIGRILELSKLDIQGSPLVMAPFDPVELIQGVLQRFQSSMEQKGLQLTADLSFPSAFTGDKEALTTALVNILDNAVKFTPEKGRIALRLRPLPDQLEIIVTNSFEKLSEEELRQIFDPFHRAKEAKASGSGLGLAIAKKIIERHGGKIEAFNAEEGLGIRLSLPS